MKKWTLILAAFGLLLCACNKDDVASSDDLVGTWEGTETHNPVTLTFEKDGTFKESGSFSSSGTWTLKDGILTSTTQGEDPVSCNVRIIGGKNALVLYDSGEDYCDYDLFYRKGATIKSGALKDGRYDAPHNGIKGNDDRTFTFIVKGNNLEMYVHAWGQHYKGTYKIENGILKYDITWGEHGEDTVDGGWFAGDAKIDFENFTFGNPHYEWVEGFGYKDVYSSFPLCVSDDGKDAYMSAAGLTRWLYLR